MSHIFSVYLGVESEKGFSGFVADNNFYCILEIVEGFNGEEGRLVLQNIVNRIKQSTITGLNEFDVVLDDCIKKNSLPLNFSLSAGFQIDTILYIKTVGEGEVLIRRGNQFATLISENNIASGKVEENDLLMFSAKHFTKELNGVKELEPIFDHKKPLEIVEALTPIMKEKNDMGAICLFVQFVKNNTIQTEEPLLEKPEIVQMTRPQTSFLQKITPLLLLKKKKVVILLVIATLFLLLILNSGKLFYQKKQTSSLPSFDTVNQKVRSNIDEAETIASSDLKSASRLLSESYLLISQYKQKMKDNKTNELEQLLNDKKKELLRMRTISPQETTDLALEEKGAKGDTFSLNGDTLSILNKSGNIYLFSLEKNTLKRFKKPELADADLIAQYDKKTYVYKKTDGIYEIAEDGKIKKVIDKDDSWNNIIAMQGYNANLYIVDAGTDDIYKYIGGETGFSEKTSYLQSGKPDLTQANSLAIDAALYIGLPDMVLKYLSGVKEDFKMIIPADEETLSITKVITYKDDDNIYLWEKGKGLLYVYGKDGSYKFQVYSSNLSKVTDVVVYKSNAYGLMSNKIYSFSLE